MPAPLQPGDSWEALCALAQETDAEAFKAMVSRLMQNVFQQPQRVSPRSSR